MSTPTPAKNLAEFIADAPKNAKGSLSVGQFTGLRGAVATIKYLEQHRPPEAGADYTYIVDLLKAKVGTPRSGYQLEVKILAGKQYLMHPVSSFELMEVTLWVKCKQRNKQAVGVSRSD